MNYIEAVSYLEEIKKYGSVPGLDSITRLLAQLGNPQEQLKIVHIAGTNGKGSILAMIESVLRRSGYRTGRYHSPVLFDTREAFEVNEQWISKDCLAEHVDKVAKAAAKLEVQGHPHPTSFEVETAIAFSYFYEEKVDVVLLETGMGGRLDATNVVTKPLVEILASISMDHMQFLGNTIEEIAFEKAGIIKNDTDVILYPSSHPIADVVKSVAKEKNARLCMADQNAIRVTEQNLSHQIFSYVSSKGITYRDMEISLLGEHQIRNSITAIEALEVLKKYFSITMENVKCGLADVKWPGRLEVIGKHPCIIRDGAHNEDAARCLAVFLQNNFTNKKIFYIMGVLKDKEYRKILEILSPFSENIFTVASTNPRAMSAEELGVYAGEYFENVTVADSVEQAVKEAKEQAGPEDLILLCGSLSFMREIEELRSYESGTIAGTLSEGCSK